MNKKTEAGTTNGSGSNGIQSNGSQASQRSPTAVASPCNQQCKLQSGSTICQGCFRSVEEIIEWPMYTDDQKREVLQLAEQRKKEANNS